MVKSEDPLTSQRLQSSLALCAGILLASWANAQHTSNFDTLNQGALNSQDGYYLPVAGSDTWMVDSYLVNPPWAIMPQRPS